MSCWNSKQKKSACVCLFVCLFPYGISGCILFPKPHRGQKEHFAIHLIQVLEGWEAALGASGKASPPCLQTWAQIAAKDAVCSLAAELLGLISSAQGEITEVFKPRGKPNLAALGKRQIRSAASETSASKAELRLLQTELFICERWKRRNEGAWWDWVAPKDICLSCRVP